MVLDQADRNLDVGSSKINVLVDTKTGKTRSLDYAVKPNSNEARIHLVGNPFAKAPAGSSFRNANPADFHARLTPLY